MSDRIISPISLRFPAELREKLEDAAKQAQRSLNAEIRMRLELTFEGKQANEPTIKMLANEIETIRIELREFVNKNNKEINNIKKTIIEIQNT